MLITDNTTANTQRTERAHKSLYIVKNFNKIKLYSSTSNNDGIREPADKTPCVEIEKLSKKRSYPVNVTGGKFNHILHRDSIYDKLAESTMRNYGLKLTEYPSGKPDRPTVQIKRPLKLEVKVNGNGSKLKEHEKKIIPQNHSESNKSIKNDNPSKEKVTPKYLSKLFSHGHVFKKTIPVKLNGALGKRIYGKSIASIASRIRRMNFYKANTKPGASN